MTDYCNNTTEYPPDDVKPRYLKNFPNEIVDLILFYVYNERNFKQCQQSLQNDVYKCSLISKQFYQQANATLWRSPVISNPASLKRFVASLTNKSIVQATNPSDSLAVEKHISIHDTDIYNILPSAYHIRRLDINGLSGWDDIQFLLIMPSLGSLETLTIDNNAKSNVTDTSLQYLPHYCPNIITLGFAPTYSFTKQFTESIIQNCLQLCRIELYLADKYIHGGIFKSLLNCPSLTTLVLQNNTEGMCGESLLSRNMVVDMMALNQLKSMAFIGPGITSTVHKIFALIQYFNNSKSWPLLTSLRCEQSYLPFGDKLMIPFIESHPHLKCLYLDSSPFSNSTLNAIGTHVPGLTHLRLGSNKEITQTGVYDLICRCHDLKQVDFMGHFPDLYPLFGRMYPEYQKYHEFVLNIADMDKIRQRSGNN